MIRKLNDDIIRHIYSFGYAEHRIYMKEMSKSIHVCGDYDPIGWPQNRVNGELLNTFLIRTHTRNELIDLFNKYNRCKCCTRHACFKPNLFNMELNPRLKPNPYYRYNVKEDFIFYPTKYHFCLCKCRHNSRHVYVAYWLKSFKGE